MALNLVEFCEIIIMFVKMSQNDIGMLRLSTWELVAVCYISLLQVKTNSPRWPS